MIELVCCIRLSRYLEQKVGIKTPTEFKECLLAHCDKLNMNEHGHDVAKFLFNAADVRRVTLFTAIIKQSEL